MRRVGLKTNPKEKPCFCFRANPLEVLKTKYLKQGRTKLDPDWWDWACLPFNVFPEFTVVLKKNAGHFDDFLSGRKTTQVNFIVHSSANNFTVFRLINWMKEYFVEINHIIFCWMMNFTRLNRRGIFWVKSVIFKGERILNSLKKTTFFMVKRKFMGQNSSLYFFHVFSYAFQNIFFLAKWKLLINFFSPKSLLVGPFSKMNLFQNFSPKRAFLFLFENCLCWGILQPSRSCDIS